MVLVWPSPRRGTGGKKTAWRKKKKQEKRLDFVQGIWGYGRSLFHFSPFSPLSADSVPELPAPFIPERAPLWSGPPSVDSPTGRLAVKQGEAVGPTGSWLACGRAGARLENRRLCQQGQVLSLQKLSTTKNSAVFLLHTVTASKLNCPGAWHPEQPHLLSACLSEALKEELTSVPHTKPVLSSSPQKESTLPPPSPPQSLSSTHWNSEKVASRSSVLSTGSKSDLTTCAKSFSQAAHLQRMMCVPWIFST